MAVEKQYLADVETILSHRYDNGGDLWATQDKCLLKGTPFLALESIFFLMEFGMELHEPILKKAADLIIERTACSIVNIYRIYSGAIG